MIGFFTSRIAGMMVAVMGVLVLVFFFIHIIPGDPVDMMLGESALPADREALRHALHLDEPLWRQFQWYVLDLTSLDLGQSIHSQKPVLLLLQQRVPATLYLAVASLILACLLAFPLGVVAAIKKDSMWDKCAMGFSLLGVSIPNFWLGPLLMWLFAYHLGWFPVAGDSGLASLILPALTLGSSMAAILSRMIRNSVLEVLGEDYIRAARAKGLSSLQVIRHHALPNAMLPVITLLGLQFGALLAGAVITETVFAWPGVGALTIDAILQRDFPVVQACVLMISCTYVVVNTLTDLVYGWVDPRIRVSPG